MGMRRLGTVVLAGVVLTAAALLVAVRTPAGAAPADSDTLVFFAELGNSYALVRNGQTSYATHFGEDHLGWAIEGDFTANPGTDLFVYGSREEADGVVSIIPDGTGATTSMIPKTVFGDYGPVVGDFDGNGLDDIIWYTANGADSLWLFQGDGSHVNVPITITHLYEWTVFDADGDGDDDILWYAPGPAADRLWLFGPGAVPVSRSVTINGHYRVIPGRFGDRPAGSPQERLMFVDDTGGYDSIWTFDSTGGHTTAPLPPIDDVYEPIVGRFGGTTRDEVIWYRPGDDAEQRWTFTPAGVVEEVPAASVFGTYDPVVGDLDGNGYEDIAWTSAQRRGTATIWRFYSGGHAQTVVDSGITRSTAHIGHTDPADR